MVFGYYNSNPAFSSSTAGVDDQISSKACCLDSGSSIPPNTEVIKRAFEKIVASIARTLSRKPSKSSMTALHGNTLLPKGHHNDFLQRAKDFTFLSFYDGNTKLGSIIVP